MLYKLLFKISNKAFLGNLKQIFPKRINTIFNFKINYFRKKKNLVE